MSGSLLDCELHCFFRDQVPKAPVSVEDSDGGSLRDDVQFGAGDDLALANLVYITWDVDDAVRVVAHQVVCHHVGGFPFGFFVRGPCFHEDFETDVVELFFANYWQFPGYPPFGGIYPRRGQFVNA